MDIELEKLKKLEHALCDAIDILRDWQTGEAKPEEKKWVVYLARQGDEHCYLTACLEDNWESVQKIYGAKTKLFVGSKHEVIEWYESHQKFVKVIMAWEDGKEIQFYSIMERKWTTLNNPSWDSEWEYRVKPEEKAASTKPCGSCVHNHCSATKEPCVSCKPGNSKYEKKLCKTCEHFDNEVDNEPCDSCIDEIGYPNWKPVKKEEKKWRPYLDTAEMIMDFKDRFKVNCPSYCEPLVWVKHKQLDFRYLVTDFFYTSVKVDNSTYGLDRLFANYTYLDGSPCGMEEKE